MMFHLMTEGVLILIVEIWNDRNSSLFPLIISPNVVHRSSALPALLHREQSRKRKLAAPELEANESLSSHGAGQ